MSELIDTGSKEYAVLVSIAPSAGKVPPYIHSKQTHSSEEFPSEKVPPYIPSQQTHSYEESPGKSEELPSELEQLTRTAGADVIAHVTARRTKIDPRFYIGSGKAEEIRDIASGVESNIVIFDCDLTPRQQQNLEELIGIKVVDRTQLILDIFARRARTNEGKLQVELAQLTYLLPRLTGRGVELSRLAGGIGIRGPGEQKLEVDRRKIRRRITKLKEEIEEIRKHRAVQRKRREEIFSVALVGYTNSGKSTLLNSLTGAGIKTEDKLFSTLDPTIRKVELPENMEVVLIDTVGFIKELPHHLIDAFKATLEEVTLADILLHVIDASHREREEQKEVVLKVINELGSGDKPVIAVLNKIDLLNEDEKNRLSNEFPDCLSISAFHKIGLDDLLDELARCIRTGRERIRVRIPYDKGELVSRIHREGHVFTEEHTAIGVFLDAEVNSELFAVVKEYEEKLHD
jgi:GTP-binding protein HflX